MRVVVCLLAVAGCQLAPDAPPRPDAPAAAPAGGVAAPAPPPVPEPEAPPLDTLARGPRGEPVAADSFRALVAAVDTSGGAAGLLSRAGDFHGDEVDAETGERWQGLYPAEGGGALRSVALRVETVRDPIVDGDAGPPTGRRVTTPLSTVRRDGWVGDDALFLVRPPRPFPPAPVATAFRGAWAVESGSLSLSLGGAGYRLGVVEGPEAANEWVTEPHRAERVVVLDDGETAQAVAHVVDRDGGRPALLWAGDLDGDGRLDLLLDESDHYNVSETALYLSSLAASGALVGRAGRHRTTGC